MSDTESKKRSYTRRTTRDRVVALLEEAIELVKARCVDPGSSASAASAATAAAATTTKAARDLLAESKREFAEAIEMKKQANAALQMASATAAPSVTAPSATAATAAPSVTAPSVTALPPLPLTLKRKTKGESKQATATVPAPLMTVPVKTSALNTTMKVKKAPSCPGGPKAFNEFLKSKRAEVEAELGANAPYSQVRTRIAQLWKESCSSAGGGAGAVKRTTRKLTKATPGRVNAPLATLPEVSESKEAEAEEEESKEEEQEAEAEQEAESKEEEQEAEAESKEEEQEQEQENTLLTPAGAGYEDLGMDDMFGMRKIKVANRNLFMTDANKGLFERNDEDDDPLGPFVGYLRNGKIVEQNAPNS